MTKWTSGALAGCEKMGTASQFRILRVPVINKVRSRNWRLSPFFRSLLGLAVAAGLLTTQLAAHHSFGAEYDANKPVTVSGVITKIDWTNPHSYFFVDVKDSKGNVANWKFEGYPPGVLYRTGWKKDVTMKKGDTITVFGWQARDGTNWAHSREVTFADGKKLFFGPPAGTGDGGTAPAVDIK